VSAVGVAAIPSSEAQGGAAEAIHVENLHKKFGQLHVLKGVSLSARDGEVIAIIGGSGSGKSTLLRCINCLENPTSGIIRVNGEEIKLKADSHGHTVPADRKQIDIGDFYADFSSIERDLGWRPTIETREGVRRTLAYYREHGSHYWD